MINWEYKHKSITAINEMPLNTIGFIYLILYDNNKIYLGKKIVLNKITLPALKSLKQRPNTIRIHKIKNNHRVPYDIIIKETNWKKYIGSYKSSLDAGVNIKRKIILEFTNTKRHLTYLEAKYLFRFNCIEPNNNFLNDNILGKFYSNMFNNLTTNS